MLAMSSKEKGGPVFGVGIVDTMTKESLPEKVALEKRPDGSQDRQIWGLWVSRESAR